ncbi:MAG: bifunctional [glutamate--ammonia ligase]-adenylyl-L-tyrosine phosphorylase/[glutamate--ammonia-ligase] adenylyltransferase [Deltaproteobacteria bacterium]
MNEFNSRNVSQPLPEPMQQQAARHWQDILQSTQDGDIDLARSFSEEVERVLGLSNFVVRTCINAPGLLQSLICSGDLQRKYGDGHLHEKLRPKIKAATDLEKLYRVLRQFRQREMVRIAWRDLAGLASLSETMEDLSDLADACLQETLDKLFLWQTAEQGFPVDSQGNRQHLVVIAMGKLGAKELNFSSDIDLIFAYPEPGDTVGIDSPVTAETFFTRLCRQLIKALAGNTEDGFVFRVDMRLRPYGENGPLVMSFEGMEEYYQSMGRDWERYAWVKARVAAGDLNAGARLLKDLKPFVYRRYIDYGTFESLREMKHLIDEEVSRKGMQGNIKLGAGGIREIEFIGQTFQLLQGGRQPLLQERSILKILASLAELGYLPKKDVRELREAYIFLRQTEHMLQEYEDKQLHHLPTAKLDQTILAAGMGYDSWQEFTASLNRHTRKVQNHFAKLFSETDSETDTRDTLQERTAALWHDQLDPDQALQLLTALDMQDPLGTKNLLADFRGSNQVRVLSPIGKSRLDRLMPTALLAIAKEGGTIETVKPFIGLLEQIIRRSSYIALLNENPKALRHLLQLITASPMIAEMVTSHPLLLDELLDARALYAPADKTALAAELGQRISHIPFDDLEQLLDELRGFKLANVLRVAAADVSEVVPIMKISDHLTFIAEVVVTAALNLAWRQMTEKFGLTDLTVKAGQGLAIIAYGKFGGLELGYGSDLDLVFLRSDEDSLQLPGRQADMGRFYTRVGQRFVHIMTAHTSAGVLYKVDMRLRPNGESGLLMSTVDSFAVYQSSKAWTWEHQALVRARPIAGDAALCRKFNKIRRAILTAPRDTATLQQEIVRMRKRMLAEQKKRNPNLFDLKNDPGGIIDIEFLVQYLVLQAANREPELVRWTDNIRQMETIEKRGLLPAEQVEMLKTAYLTYRQTVHHQTLQNRNAEVDGAEFSDLRQRIIQLWEKILANPEASRPAS